MSEPAHEPSGQPREESPATAAGDEELLAALADDFAARLRRREHPQVEDYVAKHPALAERIRKVLPAVALIEETRSTDSAPASEGPGTVIGPYKLLQQIGEGGMGVVFLAEQTRPVRRKVALKVIKAGMDTRQVIARFEAERQALAMMDHVNIARVLEAGATEAGRPYFVMELVHGVPITRYCDDNRLTPRQRLELFVPVCQAIQHAHQKGIIHRDIKPTNVMVTLYDGKPVPKVIDFGIAKATGQPLTERTLFTGFGTVVGTPEYMSPEQAELNQLDVDTRSDIYSLGVLLYELLTGSTPLEHNRFKAAALLEMLRVVREEEPPRPSTRLSTSERLPAIAASRGLEPKKLSGLVRGELDWIVMKALEKDRNRRYETAIGLAADVKRYLDDDAVQACPPSATYRLRKFARRYKGILATAAAVGVALMLAVGSVGWVMRDRASRRAALEFEVARALDEAEAGYQRDALPEADAAVRQAEGLLASGAGAGEQVAQRVRRWRADLTMVARLEEIEFQREGLANVWARIDAAAAYREAFQRYGLDVEALEPGVAAGRMRASNVRNRLVAALDDWPRARSDPTHARRLAVARAADPDPWRDRLREAFARRDRAAMAELARDKQVTSQPLASVLLLGEVLRASQEIELAVELYRQAHPRHADSFWMNYRMGAALLDSSDSRTEESAGFLRAAVALRPKSPWPRLNLFHALRRHGNSLAAEAECRQLVHMSPDFAQGHYWLGMILQSNGHLAEAVPEFREAIRLIPELRVAYSGLGKALGELGNVADAMAVYESALRLTPDTAQESKAGVHYDIGNTYAQHGHWPEAAAAFHRSIECGPENHQAWYMTATLDLAAGDAEAYRRTCGQMLQQFGNAEDVMVAERTAKVCSLMPGAVDDVGVVEELARRAVRGTEKHGYYRYFTLAQGLVEYRAGRYAEAVKWLQRVSPQAGGVDWDAMGFSILAMANHRLARPQEAAAALHEAQAILSAKMPDRSKGRPFKADDWHDWLHSQILCREAADLLMEEPPAGAPKSEAPPGSGAKQAR